MLSSGFGDVKKVEAFVRAEYILGEEIFDSLGVGGIFPSYAATMDIIGVGNAIDRLYPVSKAGRMYQPNRRIKLY